MRKMLKLIVLLPIAIGLIVFCIGNRQPALVSLDPFALSSQLQFQLPVYAIVLGALAFGVLLGGSATWVKQGRFRKAARKARTESEKLHLHNQQLRNEVAALTQKGVVKIESPVSPP